MELSMMISGNTKWNNWKLCNNNLTNQNYIINNKFNCVDKSMESWTTYGKSKGYTKN